MVDRFNREDLNTALKALRILPISTDTLNENVRDVLIQRLKDKQLQRTQVRSREKRNETATPISTRHSALNFWNYKSTHFSSDSQIREELQSINMGDLAALLNTCKALQKHNSIQAVHFIACLNYESFIILRKTGKFY